jgi:Fe-Mn family superoxide dismutase
VFKLPPLPYAYDALLPTISAVTMRLHHDKHHAKYVETANTLVEQHAIQAPSLEAVIVEAAQGGLDKLYDNAAQAWNHAFFWSCMSPTGAPLQGELAGLIDQVWGGLPQLREAFVAEGAAHFGSGWIWLLASPEGLAVRATHDGRNLVGEERATPLLVCDLWEHAYYLDYKNDRKGFLEAWFDALPDWAFAEHQLAASRGSGEPWRYPAPQSAEARRRSA